MNASPRIASLLLAALAALAALSAACSSSSPAPAGSGGPVSGPTDMHCVGMKPQPTNQSDCHVTAIDGGAGTGGGGSDYGQTMDNQAGDDDDCKYHVSWTSTPIAENQDLTFTVTASYLTDGSPNPPACANCPVTGLNTQNFYVELGYSDMSHPPPTIDDNQVVKTTSTPGTYTVGPVQFDKSGTWTARFHLFELCADVADDSPHGHAAFYIHVP